MRRLAMMIVALATGAQADAAMVTRDFTLTASRFLNFNDSPSPIKTLNAKFRLTYDDAVSGFQGAPVSFAATTNGVADVGPFAATPIFGFFPANAFSTFPRLGVGGALNGGNVLLNRTDDFYFTFDASAKGPTSAMLSFTSVDFATPFTATDATVTPVDVAAAVPEPATWAMFIGGTGLIGTVLRRRNRRVLNASLA